jgi:PEP-CTERM motif
MIYPEWVDVPIRGHSNQRLMGVFMTNKIFAMVGAATAAIAFSASAHAATYVYVGSYTPASGPAWTTNPLAYSGVGAAALLFGGSAADYAISTVDNTEANIDHKANYEVIGVGSNVFAENYFRGVEGTTHYQDVYIGDPATDTVSAYVSDFSNQRVNYVFRRIDGAVPEPATWGMMLAGFGVVGGAMRRRQRTTVSFA